MVPRRAVAPETSPKDGERTQTCKAKGQETSTLEDASHLREVSSQEEVLQVVADTLAGVDILEEAASQEAAVLPGALVALLAAEEVREEEDTRVFLRARGINSRERRVLAVGSFLVFASRQVAEAVPEVRTFQ